VFSFGVKAKMLVFILSATCGTWLRSEMGKKNYCEDGTVQADKGKNLDSLFLA